MKITHSSLSVVCSLLILVSLCACRSGETGASGILEHEYKVAAYVWPSCHDEARSREVFWGEGEGEWEIVRKGDPRFKGHYQPRIPLWGYRMDDDPRAFEQKIRAATAYGVNVFIFDWYWYEGEPFLESALNKGFLGAKNCRDMEFYLMWANHDVNGSMWNRYLYPQDTTIWNGEVSQTEFEGLVERVITRYFTQPNYMKIDGAPVFSVFSFQDLYNSFGDLEGLKEALDYFRAEVRKAGFPDLHFQPITIGFKDAAGLLTAEEAGGRNLDELAAYLGINSLTTYNWRMSGIEEDYIRWGEAGMAYQERWAEACSIPYFPVVSVGWDNTARFARFGREEVAHIRNTPASFAAYLQRAKDIVDREEMNPPLILINAWNEWVEGAYLEPDMNWGYGYLEAVKRVMSGTYDPYRY